MPPVLPLVSVCMATRNRATIAAQALESLRSQSYRNIEIVLVDDASDAADARAWLDQIEPEFEQSGWRIIRRSTRGRPSAARNFAASMARGEYLLFMDDDNIARPTEIETFVRAALHSGAPVLTCVVEQFRHEQDGADPRPFLRWLPLGGATAYGLISNKFGDTNMLVRKDIFHRLGGFANDGLEDWLFLSRAAVEGIEIDVVPEPLFLYRVWDGSHGRAFATQIATHRRCAPYLRGRSTDWRAMLLYTIALHERRTLNLESEVVDKLNRERVSARFARATAQLALGPGDAWRLRAQQQLEVDAVDDGIHLRSLGPDPIAWLPWHPPPHVHSIVRIEMTTTRPTIAQLFWSTLETPFPTEQQSTMVAFPAGRHVRWAEIPAARHVRNLRFDPAAAPGEIVLHALEARCETGASRAEIVSSEHSAGSSGRRHRSRRRSPSARAGRSTFWGARRVISPPSARSRWVSVRMASFFEPPEAMHRFGCAMSGDRRQAWWCDSISRQPSRPSHNCSGERAE